jgi:hypothetical protein
MSITYFKLITRSPGVYYLRDPRSRIYNFDPYLEKIMPIEEFDYDKVDPFTAPSQDAMLENLANIHNKRYRCSSSSTTAALSHFHYLLSNWRPLNFPMVTRSFPMSTISHQPTQFYRSPTSVFLRYSNGRYALDNDKEFDETTSMSALGTSLEKLLTLPVDIFERYRKSYSGKMLPDQANHKNIFQHSTIGNFLLRAQLDAHDPRLPGSGVFDIKTRVVVSIRKGARYSDEGLLSGYEIRYRTGEWESFEREFQDLARSMMLKYSLQARIGNMDGIFLAYHNMVRLFGFQYLPLSDLDEILHSQSDPTLGDAEFKLSMGLLNIMLDKITQKYPRKVSSTFVNLPR